jgi:hypothetical protein
VLRAQFLPDVHKLVFSIARRIDRTGEAYVRIDNVWSNTLKNWQLTRRGSVIARSNGNEVLASSIKATRKGDSLELRWSLSDVDHFVLTWSQS